jgi:hydroxypyruvate isomerase
MKLAANISLLYPGLPLTERISTAARDGFEAIEILYPYDLSHETLNTALQANNLALTLINTPLGPNGEKGLASLPGKESDFEAGCRQALAVCAATGCTTIHVMAGQLEEGANREIYQATLVNNLKKMAPEAAKQGVTLTLEALNRRDVPRYFYYRPDQVIEILEAVNHPNVRLQFDFYHTEVEKLDLNKSLEQSLPWVQHVQFAHPDGRHEPDLRSPAVVNALRTLISAKYSGWLGCEYTPRTTPSEGLVWRKAYWELVANAEQH